MNPLRAFLIVLVGLVWPLGAAEKLISRAAKVEGLPAKIWSDPGDVAGLDLFHGAGGAKHAPNPRATYTFLRSETKGANPKFDVEDDAGNHWRVKLGNEAQAETAATRLVWAGGYFVDEVYYLPEIKVTGVPKVFLSPQGLVVGARLERRSKAAKRLGHWDWFDNRFDGTRELNGLRVAMALINNWDLKEPNNAILQIGDEQRFLVSDLGAVFGRTGGIGDRTKNMLVDYEAAQFIDKMEPEYVNFVLHSRPIFDPFSFSKLAKREKIGKHIPRTDALWVGQRLARLSNQQILDCFRAGGYAPLIAERYTAVVRKRIAELNSL